MKRIRNRAAIALVIALGLVPKALGQPYGKADRDEPGDAMIQAHLARLAKELESTFPEDVEDADAWKRDRPQLLEEYRYMLGISPMPERSPLQATVTGTLEGDGYRVENLHYQSVPGLYVTANLYLPEKVEPGDRLPAVLYVCGHSGMGRDGNKVAYQAHGIWFARHGYVCLVVDTLQLGEIEGVHHGTYREGRWWWHSRGYTPSGVECWNGIRGIDYLISRDDVDADRIAVTGISGGGAVSFWIASADDRVQVAVPVSGMADLESYVGNRVINGHCDCMFLYNTFAWPWTKIAGLVAPRPLLFVNSDADAIFPMDANDRVIARLERLYSHFGASDQVDAVVSIGGHAYREDLRKAAYRFINMHLKDDPRIVADSEVDLIVRQGSDESFPIARQRLRVFPTDDDIPADALNGEIDDHFVPLAEVDLPESADFEDWKARLLTELRRVTFGALPERVEPARPVAGMDDPDALWLETEPGIKVPLRPVSSAEMAERVVLLIAGQEDEDPSAEAVLESIQAENDAIYRLSPRGVGPTRWTRKDPPNYVKRSHVLLGRTVDSERVLDIAATARYLKREHGESVPIVLAGSGSSGALGAYAALLEPDISEVVLIDPPRSHMDKNAPQLLNVLRVLDLPETLGMLAPRPLSIVGDSDELLNHRVRSLYERAGATDQLQVR
ncbi:acetylxylan esterase [soil metagenome]